MKDFFRAPGVFDGFINVLVQELRKSPIRPHLCDPTARAKLIDQFVHALMSKCDEVKWELHDFKEIFEKLRVINLILKKSDLSPEYQIR